MAAYWLSLDLFQRILTIIAVPASILLVVQFVIIIVRSAKLKGEAVPASPAQEKAARGLSIKGTPLITFKGICAFLAIGAWSGVLAVSMGCSDIVAGAVALVMGAVATVVIALAFNLD